MSRPSDDQAHSSTSPSRDVQISSNVSSHSPVDPVAYVRQLECPLFRPRACSPLLLVELIFVKVVLDVLPRPRNYVPSSIQRETSSVPPLGYCVSKGCPKAKQRNGLGVAMRIALLAVHDGLPARGFSSPIRKPNWEIVQVVWEAMHDFVKNPTVRQFSGHSLRDARSIGHTILSWSSK